MKDAFSELQSIVNGKEKEWFLTEVSSLEYAKAVVLLGRVTVMGAHLHAIEMLSEKVFEIGKQLMTGIEEYLQQQPPSFVLPDDIEATFAQCFFFNTVVLYTIGHADVYGKNYPIARKVFKVSIPHLTLFRNSFRVSATSTTVSQQPSSTPGLNSSSPASLKSTLTAACTSTDY